MSCPLVTVKGNGFTVPSAHVKRFPNIGSPPPSSKAVFFVSDHQLLRQPSPPFPAPPPSGVGPPPPPPTVLSPFRPATIPSVPRPSAEQVRPPPTAADFCPTAVNQPVRSPTHSAPHQPSYDLPLSPPSVTVPDPQPIPIQIPYSLAVSSTTFPDQNLFLPLLLRLRRRKTSTPNFDLSCSRTFSAHPQERIS
ncbi:hypothetical protein TIFTF001_002965 [Ficus carica]|uniref:Uncharacterized protein n=1 Tax=Ficus carica TaxID=3494 RepID=A0AA88CT97_FICCA|nr:hypothetical protein TIFTF001_002965 [Ficus carica]